MALLDVGMVSGFEVNEDHFELVPFFNLYDILLFIPLQCQV